MAPLLFSKGTSMVTNQRLQELIKWAQARRWDQKALVDTFPDLAIIRVRYYDDIAEALQQLLTSREAMKTSTPTSHVTQHDQG